MVAIYDISINIILNHNAMDPLRILLGHSGMVVIYDISINIILNHPSSH